MSDECVLDDGEEVTAWLDGRQMRCLFFAILIPALVSGFLFTFLDFWELPSDRFVYVTWMGDDPAPAPDLMEFIEAWIKRQFEYTAMSSLFIAVLGLPLFLFGLCWYESGVSKRGLIAGVVAVSALLGVLVIASEYEPTKFHLLAAAILKFAFLIFISFATSGAWIAWQAWRAAHAEEKFWPQFSLATLLIGVMSCGALLGMFAPE
jgi:hypothetical protein